MSMKNSNDTVRIRTRDIQVCSELPQPTALMRTTVTLLIIKISVWQFQLLLIPYQESRWRTVNLSESCRVIYRNKVDNLCFFLAFIIRIITGLDSTVTVLNQASALLWPLNITDSFPMVWPLFGWCEHIYKILGSGSRKFSLVCLINEDQLTEIYRISFAKTVLCLTLPHSVQCFV